MANQPPKENLYYLALKRITNAKINLILAITILFFVGALNVGKMKFRTSISRQMWWQISRKIMSIKIYISKRASV